jgi:hypothetical protein
MPNASELFAFLELLAIWLVVGIRYRALPALIHSPFNGGGGAHGLGPRNQLWLLLILATIGYLFLTALARLKLPINVPPGTTEATIAEIRRRIPTVFTALKITLLALILWIVVLVTHTPPPHHRLITVLLALAFFAVNLGFPLSLLLLLRGNPGKAQRTQPEVS